MFTWSFAHQMGNTVEVCDDGGDGICGPGDHIRRVDDPFQRGGTVSQFYIATDF